jgi:Ca2+-binding RTX toxin-like protein
MDRIISVRLQFNCKYNIFIRLRVYQSSKVFEMLVMEISGNNIVQTIPSGSVAPNTQLLISGNRNNVTVLFNTFENLQGGPAVTITGTGNLFINRASTIRTNGIVALQGSEGRDEIVNYGGLATAIIGEVRLGGGNDYYQTNFNATAGDVHGDDGDDTLNSYELTSAVRYFGDAGNDGLAGGSADDYLDGGSGSDELFGNAGNDTLIGGSGIDRLNGGSGNDSLIGDDNDIAMYGPFDARALFADVQIIVSNGTVTVTDLNSSDGDIGTDTLTGINILRFVDQQVDLRLTRNELLLETPGQEFTNTVARYGLRSGHISGEGVTLINQNEIRGTGVNGAGGAVLIDADNVTLDNRAGGSIVGIGNAVELSGRTRQVDGGFSYVGAEFKLINAGIVEGLEGTGVSFFANNAIIINAVSGSITGVDSGISVLNGFATINNAGTITGLGKLVTLQGGQTVLQGGAAINAGVLDLINTGTIIGNPVPYSFEPGAIQMTSRFSQIVNHGVIEGGYYAYGGARIDNRNQSSGDFRIDTLPNGQDANVNTNNQGFQVASLVNSGTFNGSFILSGATNFNSAPAGPVVFSAEVKNSGTFNGNIISNPTTQALPGGIIPDVRYDEYVTNSGSISGFLDLGKGNDVVVNTGSISGLIDLGAGSDIFQGGMGDELVRPGAGSDTIVGAAGIDTVDYSDAEGAIYIDIMANFALETGLQTGTVSNTTAIISTDDARGFENIIGSRFGDRIYGSDDANRLDSGAGDDVIYAEGGDDVVIGGTGSDVLIGGAGNDTVDYGGSLGGVFLDINAGFAIETALQAGTVVASTAVVSTDLMAQFENANGTNYGDRIYGSAVANVLNGLVGDDIIYAEEGDDSVISGAGSDILLGGSGTDTLDYSSAVGAVFADLAGNTVETGLTAGTVSAGTTALSTDLHAQFENLTGSAFGDRLYGTAIANRLDGGAGDDILYGGGGNDVLLGGAGNDRIIGEGGADTMTGGDGADRFFFTTAANSGAVDSITDFVAGLDSLLILRSAFGIGAGDPLVLEIDAPASQVNSFIYDSASGRLSFDADGAGGGAAIAVADIGAGLALTSADIVLYG